MKYETFGILGPISSLKDACGAHFNESTQFCNEDFWAGFFFELRNCLLVSMLTTLKVELQGEGGPAYFLEVLEFLFGVVVGEG